MLPIVDGDDLICPYCKPRHSVRLIEESPELREMVQDARSSFNIRPGVNYQLGGKCDGCSTVWLAEKVDPKSNRGKPYAWDRFSPSSDQRFKD